MASLTGEHRVGKHRRKIAGCPECYPKPETMLDMDHPPKVMAGETIVSAVILADTGEAEVTVKAKRAKPRKIILAPDKGVMVEPAKPTFAERMKAARDRKAAKVEAPVLEVISTEVIAVPPPEAIVGETREAWMLRAVEAMRPWFPKDAQVPQVRVSIGFPSGRGSSRLIGQCWYTVDDDKPALFVSPELSSTVDIATTLLHEMVHAAVGSGHGHKGKFLKVATGLGFEKPMRTTPPSEGLKARVAQVVWELGEFPHSKVNKTISGSKRDTQSTRMLKVACPDCGCLIRMTRKWLDEVGAPVCADGTQMLEGIA